MQLIEVVNQVLETGVLPVAVERKMQKLLRTEEFDETEIAAVDRLIDALMRGAIQSTA
ncbi:MAG: hypothetical protein HC866_19725 [Leptolyngbyaceae cyanobacterium RU_5_1]|nr:hypothetical protein [Leptolyngbyaceae cyanobacterium RU_5_1]